MSLPLNVVLEDLLHALRADAREIAAEEAKAAVLEHIAAEKPEKYLLSCPEVARALGIDARKVRQLVKDGTIPSFVIGTSNPKIRRPDMEAYCRQLLAEQTKTARHLHAI